MTAEPRGADTASAQLRIFGQDQLIAYLRGIASRDEQGAFPHLRHAYLFTGEAGSGKSAVACWMAQTLVCRETEGAPCGHCADCRLLQKGNHPDFLQVSPVNAAGDPDRRRGLLRVEQASTVQAHTVLRPFQSDFRIVLIQDLHFAHESFLNKLLKTFEEPPAAAVLLGTATDSSRILPTLVSRCQQLPLRPVGPAAMESILIERYSTQPERAQLLSRLAQGRMGWAVARRADEELWNNRRRSRQLLADLIPASRAQRLGLAEGLLRSSAGDSGPLLSELGFWTYWWRDVWLSGLHGTAHCVNVDCLEEIADTARRTRPEQVQDFLRHLERGQFHLRSNVNPRLVLSHLVLRMPVATRAA